MYVHSPWAQPILSVYNTLYYNPLHTKGIIWYCSDWGVRWCWCCLMLKGICLCMPVYVYVRVCVCHDILLIRTAAV